MAIQDRIPPCAAVSKEIKAVPVCQTRLQSLREERGEELSALYERHGKLSAASNREPHKLKQLHSLGSLVPSLSPPKPCFVRKAPKLEQLHSSGSLIPISLPPEPCFVTKAPKLKQLLSSGSLTPSTLPPEPCFVREAPKVKELHFLGSLIAEPLPPQPCFVATHLSEFSGLGTMPASVPEAPITYLGQPVLKRMPYGATPMTVPVDTLSSLDRLVQGDRVSRVRSASEASSSAASSAEAPRTCLCQSLPNSTSSVTTPMRVSLDALVSQGGCMSRMSSSPSGSEAGSTAASSAEATPTSVSLDTLVFQSDCVSRMSSSPAASEDGSTAASSAEVPRTHLRQSVPKGARTAVATPTIVSLGTLVSQGDCMSRMSSSPTASEAGSTAASSADVPRTHLRQSVPKSARSPPPTTVSLDTLVSQEDRMSRMSSTPSAESTVEPPMTRLPQFVPKSTRSVAAPTTVSLDALVSQEDRSSTPSASDAGSTAESTVEPPSTYLRQSVPKSVRSVATPTTVSLGTLVSQEDRASRVSSTPSASKAGSTAESTVEPPSTHLRLSVPKSVRSVATPTTVPLRTLVSPGDCMSRMSSSPSTGEAGSTAASTVEPPSTHLRQSVPKSARSLATPTTVSLDTLVSQGDCMRRMSSTPSASEAGSTAESTVEAPSTHLRQSVPESARSLATPTTVSLDTLVSQGDCMSRMSSPSASEAGSTAEGNTEAPMAHLHHSVPNSMLSVATPMIVPLEALVSLDSLVPGDRMGRMGSSPYTREASNSAASNADSQLSPGTTTLLVRRLPFHCPQHRLIEELMPQAEYQYDFLKVPYNPEQRRPCQYCFVNFASTAAAQAFVDHWHGCHLVRPIKGKPLDIQPAPAQGLRELVKQHLRELIKQHLPKLVKQHHLSRADGTKEPAVFTGTDPISFEELWGLWKLVKQHLSCADGTKEPAVFRGTTRISFEELAASFAAPGVNSP